MLGTNVYIRKDEGKFLAMAVLAMLEDLSDSSKDEKINWNPSARKTIKEMIAAGQSLKSKLQNLGIDMAPLPPYLDGDEKEFLTKES